MGRHALPRCTHGVLTHRTTGYSLAFRPGTPVIGGASRFWLLGMEVWSIHPLAPTIPESVYMARGAGGIRICVSDSLRVDLPNDFRHHHSRGAQLN